VLSDPDDQVHVRRYFHADAASAIDNAMLSEETLRSRRIRLKGYVRHYFRGNVKRVVFVDELPHVRAEQQEGEDTEETRSQISPPSPALPSPRSGG